MIFSKQIASLLCKVAVKFKAFRRVRHLFTSGARRYVSFLFMLYSICTGVRVQRVCSQSPQCMNMISKFSCPKELRELFLVFLVGFILNRFASDFNYAA